MRFGLLFIAFLLAVMPSLATAEPATIRTFEAKIYSTSSTGGWVVGELPEGTKVSVSEDSINGFRRIRLNDGSIGYVEERCLLLTNAPGASAGGTGVGTIAAPKAVAPVPATSQPAVAPQVPESNARRHKGFFLRMDGGFGYGGSSTSQGTYNATVSGADSQFGIAIGGAVAENVILAGDMWGGVLLSPRVTVRGATGTLSASASLIGFGPHLSYYFMPANVYLSVTPSITMVSLTYNGNSANTKAGFGGKVALGKEWWLGDRWGLGIAAQFLFSFNVDEGINPPTWTTLGGGAAFSATFN